MSERVTWMDSVRGMAALIVVFGHWIAAFGPTRTEIPALWNSPLALFSDGFAAVSLFFVLSGVVLARKPLRDPGAFRTASAYLAFAFARAARILLPYWTVLGLAILVLQGDLRGPPSSPAATAWLNDFWSQSRSPGSWLKQAWLTDPLRPRPLVPQAWTLVFELTLSLLVPVLVVLAQRSLFLLPVFVLLGINLWGLPSFLVAFALGVAIARASEIAPRHAAPARGIRWLPWGALGIGSALYAWRGVAPWLGVTGPAIQDEGVVWYVTMAGSGILLWALSNLPRAQRFLSMRALVYLGRVSFGVYLLHMLVLVTVAPHALNLLEVAGVASERARWWLGFLVVVALTLGLAEVFFRLVEQPAIRLGRYAGKRIQNSVIGSGSPSES